jgi:Putative transmembrane protein (Alph_Pro_TM)
MRRPLWLAVALCTGLVACLWAVASAASVTITPNPIAIDTFFNGTALHVRGSTRAGNHVVVKITGGTATETFNVKGRVAGLWASVGKVSIGGVPHVHLVAGDLPVNELLGRDDIDRLQLDLDAVARQATVTPGGQDDARLRQEYVKLKTGQGVFAAFNDAVTMTVEREVALFDALVTWPSKAPPGDYDVEVFHVRDGRIAESETARLSSRLVGVTAWVGKLAVERSATYGVLSVFAALTVGFLMGMLFKRRTAGH